MTMKSICLWILLLINISQMVAQVGIGTITPTAELEINAVGTLPALEIAPQLSPVGTATGQLSIIGDKLYMYDATRASWLTVESSAIQFGRNGNVDTDNIHFGGNMVAGNSGALMPYDGTIVAITAMAASGDDTDLNLRARNILGTNSINETFQLSALRYLDTTANFEFNEGDYLTLRARDGTTTATDVTIVLWVKWRQ